MKIILSKYRAFMRRQYKRIDALYGDDRELKFRAWNLLIGNGSIGVGLFAVLLFVLLVGDNLIDSTSRLAFGSILLASIAMLGISIREVLSSKLNSARRLSMTLAVVSTFSITMITGGFPGPEYYPLLFIPVVLAFCIYGGRAGVPMAIAVPVFILAQWVAQTFLGVKFPDVSAAADPTMKRATVLATTYFIAIFAFISYDKSNRWYIKQSQAATEGKASFLANMSHEIRTPMNGVIGFSDVMLKTDLDERQKVFMEAINSSGKSLLNIINDILDYSKIEAGRMDMVARPFNLRDLLQDVITLLSISAGPKDVALDLYYPDTVPKIFIGDPGRIRQVVMNLAGNAVKFTHDGRVMIKASTRQRNGQSRLRIDVHDTGIGIPADKIDSIFEQFTQADSSTTQEYGGTGLGLTITRRLVELMNGEIHVTSEEGVGSVFSIDIEAPIAPTFKNVMMGTEDGDMGDVADGPKILLLPSSTEPLTGFAEALMRLGYRPHMASVSEKILPFMASDDFVRDWAPVVIVGVSEADRDYQAFMTAIDAAPALAHINRIGAHHNQTEIPPYDPRLKFLIIPDISDADLRAVIERPAVEADELAIAS